MSKTIFFKCVKDFTMDDGDVVFHSGAIYPAEISGSVGVRMLDVSCTKEFSHNMEIDEDYFTSSFVELHALDNWHGAQAAYKLERGYSAKLNSEGNIEIQNSSGDVRVNNITLADAKQFVNMLS